MSVLLAVRNESSHKRLFRSRELLRLAERIREEEDVQGEIELSLLFCDDAFIRELNRQYRRVDQPTDVLSFGQKHPVHQQFNAIGDIVISLETVERQCAGDRERMRAEIRLLFCHGMLHLLGYTHGSERGRKRMTSRQASVLGILPGAAWRGPAPIATGKKPSRPRCARKEA